MRITRLIFSGCAVLVSAAGVQAQQPTQPPTPAVAQPPAPRRPDISGIWTRVDTAGGGSYDGIDAAFPRAQLQPEFASRLPPERFEGIGAPPPGFVPPAYDINTQNTGPARCAVGGGGVGGPGGININSAGMSLMASNDLVLMLRDGQQGGRHIYADGRPFPERLAGIYSIGRWEGDAFVVTVRGFGSAMVGFGRGWTEPSTVLTETYRLQPGGNRLTITYTYTDPKVYIKPHTFDMVFDRLPPNQYVFESWCDSREWMAAQKAPAPAAARPAGQ